MSYTTLKTEIADWLNRSDLTAVIPTFISDAESSLRRDVRCRKLQERSPFTVSSDNVDLPSDLQSIEALYHDGTSYHSPVEIIGADDLGRLKGLWGTTGVPAFAAVVGSKLRFAPVPDDTFDLKLLYWLKIEALSASNTTNWLLDDHPDIYRTAALLEAAPYLKNDERIPVWRDKLTERLEQLHLANWQQQFGGGTVRLQRAPIGG